MLSFQRYWTPLRCGARIIYGTLVFDDVTNSCWLAVVVHFLLACVTIPACTCHNEAFRVCWYNEDA